MSAINFRNALGIHEQALNLRASRAEVLANNLANADTPGFKARDIDFAAVLEQATAGNGGSGPRRTDTRHIGGLDNRAEGALLFRVPSQPSIDGNSVEEHAEMARYAKNATDFEASLYFLNSKFSGLKSAIRGEVQ
jgi:flagellar basal-body rod protein FlgB